MKKAIVLIFAVAFVIVMLSGCGSGKKDALSVYYLSGTKYVKVSEGASLSRYKNVTDTFMVELNGVNVSNDDITFNSIFEPTNDNVTVVKGVFAGNDVIYVTYGTAGTATITISVISTNLQRTFSVNINPIF